MPVNSSAFSGPSRFLGRPSERAQVRRLDGNESATQLENRMMTSRKLHMTKSNKILTIRRNKI